MATFDPGPLAQVSSRPDGRRWTLVLVRNLRHPPEKVWPALVRPEQLSRWALFTADRDLEATPSGTRLTLAHTVDEHTTTADVAAGWHLCLVVAEHLLGGDPLAPITGTAALGFGWAEQREAYAAALGTTPARGSSPVPPA